MQADDMILISVDDHVVEPADMFERHVPARWKQRAPRIYHTVGEGSRPLPAGVRRTVTAGDVMRQLSAAMAE